MFLYLHLLWHRHIGSYERTSFQRDYQSLVTGSCGKETQLLTPNRAPEHRDLGR